MSDDHFFVQRFPGTFLHFALLSVLGCGLQAQKGPSKSAELRTSSAALEEDQNNEEFDVEPAPQAGPGHRGGGDDGARRVITIDYPGSIATVAKGINSDGDVVGFYQDVGKAFHGFLLRQGSFSAIDFPGASFTRCVHVVARGEMRLIAASPCAYSPARCSGKRAKGWGS